MNRELLEAEAAAYTKGENKGYREGYIYALELGRNEGIAMERSRVRKVEWRKLFTVTVAASVIGCGIVLAVAMGLSNL